MRPIPALIYAVLLCSTASAVELSLVGNGRNQSLDLELSETGTISIWMDLGPDEDSVASARMYFDQLGIDSFDVEDATVAPPWRTDREGMEFPLESLEDFVGSYGVENLSGPWRGNLDVIFLHGTVVGQTDVYFEGPDTGGQRPPQIFDREGGAYPYSGNLPRPGFLWFSNGWRDEDIGFDRPFPVTVIPEVATVGMFLIGGAALFAGRRRVT